MTLGHVDFPMTLSFIAAVKAAGMVELAKKLRRDDFNISKVLEELKEHRALREEFAGYVRDWHAENNYPEDEPPEGLD